MLYLELGNFMYPDAAKPDETINLRPHLEELFGTNILPGTVMNKHILIGEYVTGLREFRHGSDISAWRGTIEALNKERCQAFQGNLFFYIYREEMSGLSQGLANEHDTLYKCKAGKGFSLKVYYSVPNYGELSSDTKRRTVHYETSSDVIEVLGRNNFVLSKYGSEHLRFSAELLKQNAKRCAIYFKALGEPFKAPAPELTIEIESIARKFRQTLGLGTAFIGLAGALVGVSGALATQLNPWYLTALLLGAFVIFYFGGWCRAKYIQY